MASSLDFAGDVRTLHGAITFQRAITEADVVTFAALTSDAAPIHLDASYAAGQPVGRRIAHGALLVGLMSAAASRWVAQESIDALSGGYDGVRFLRPVYLGDTVVVGYARWREEPLRRRIVAAVQVRNQHDELVAVASHILVRT